MTAKDPGSLHGRVAAIIPTFDRAEFLHTAIESVLEQGSIIGQVIVCDDGSTDDTPSVVQAFGPAVTYLRQDNAGKSVALNNALAHVTMPFVWICDDDDIALPGTVAQLVDALDADPAAGMAYGMVAQFRDTSAGREVTPNERRKQHTTDAFLQSLINNFIMQQATVFRTGVLADIGPFDAGLLRSQDWDYALRATARYESRFVPILVYLWRSHDGLRGPLNDRFAESEREKRWQTYDVALMRKTLAAIPPERFSLVEDGPPDRKLASAHLVRAIVAFREGVWEEGMAEVERFVELTNAIPGFALTRAERSYLSEIAERDSELLAQNAPTTEVFRRLGRIQDKMVKAVIRTVVFNALMSLSKRLLIRRAAKRLGRAMWIMAQVPRIR